MKEINIEMLIFLAPGVLVHFRESLPQKNSTAVAELPLESLWELCQTGPNAR